MTCTYTNKQLGALKITKASSKAAATPLADATFSITGPNSYSKSVTTGSDGTPTGNVTFTLFDGADCTGNVLIPEVTRPLSSGVASTNNTTVAVSSSKTVYWKVEYPGDANHNSVSSCVENTALTITNGEKVTGT